MTYYIQSTITSQSANGSYGWILQSDDSLYLTQTGAIYATGPFSTGVIGYGNSTVTVAGEIVAETGIQIGTPSISGSATVIVLEGGVVSGFLLGIFVNGNFDQTIQNAGSVSGQTAILLGVSSSSVDNTGAITGVTYGIQAYYSDTTVQNAGTISGGQFGIHLGFGFNTIVNSGSILSDEYGIVLGGGVGDPNKVTNTGLISGGDWAIFAYSADDRVVNQGTVVGAVRLGEGADFYDGRLGSIDGDVLGQGGNDKLMGGAGAETLDGGTGDDVLKGFGDDDVYGYDSLLDRVSEKGGSGEDTVNGAISVDLVSGKFFGEVEDVLLLAGLGNLSAYGNALDNTLIGNEFANTLDGRAGADTLVGLLGNDVYVVDSAGDVVDETGGGGVDTVRASVSFSLVPTASVAGAVERIELTGSAAINATGNASNNFLAGNAGVNTLTGGGGADSFRFVAALTPTNADTIADMVQGADTIALDNAVMVGLGATTGTLGAAAFWASAAGVAHDADDRIVYDIDDGILWYDADGTGAGAAMRVANLGANLGLTNTDFTII